MGLECFELHWYRLCSCTGHEMRMCAATDDERAITSTRQNCRVCQVSHAFGLFRTVTRIKSDCLIWPSVISVVSLSKSDVLLLDLESVLGPLQKHSIVPRIASADTPGSGANLFYFDCSRFL